MAAEYSREMGIKCFAGCKRLAELGFKQGGTPGYGLRRLMISADGQQKKILSRGEVKSLRTDRVILVPGPEEEVGWVREMYRLVIEENKTPYSIASELNRRGVRCPEGKWRVARVCRILTDPKYIGYNVWNRTSRQLGHPTAQMPKANWLLTPNAFEPVVNSELFERAQAVLAEQRRPYSREALLDGLRELLTTHGTLCHRIVKNSLHLPSVNTFVRRFGSLRRAFELAGRKYQREMVTDEHARQARRLRNQLLDRTTSLFPREVSVFRPDADGPDCLQVDGCLTVSVIVCPAVRRNNRINWVVDNGGRQKRAITFLARLTADNTQFRDFYILPAPGSHLLRHRGELKKGKQLSELSEFCSVVRAVASHQRSGHQQLHSGALQVQS